MIGDVLTLFFQDDVEHYRIDNMNDETLEVTGESGKTVLPHTKGLLDSCNGRKITGFTLTPAPSPFIVGAQVRVAFDDQLFDAEVVDYENHVLEILYRDEHYYLDMDNLPTEVQSVAPLEVQDVEEVDSYEGAPDETLLLECQIRSLQKALTPHDATWSEKAEIKTMVTRFKELHAQFTNTAFEPASPPSILEGLQKNPPPWIVPVIADYKKLAHRWDFTCDEQYLDPTKTKGRYAAYNHCITESFFTFESSANSIKLGNRLEAAAMLEGKLIPQVVVDEPVRFEEYKQLPCSYSTTSLYAQVSNEACVLGFYDCKRKWLPNSLSLDVNVDELLDDCAGTSFVEVVEELATYGVKWWHVTPAQRQRIDAGVRGRIQRFKPVSKGAPPSTSLPKADPVYLLPPMLSSERLVARLGIDGLRAHLGNADRLKERLALRRFHPKETIEIKPSDEKEVDVVSAFYGADAAGALSIFMRYGRDAKREEDKGWAYFHEGDAKLAPLCLFDAFAAMVHDGGEAFEQEKRRIAVVEVDGYRVNSSGAIVDPIDFKEEERDPEKVEEPWSWLWKEATVPLKERWRATNVVEATALAIVFGANKRSVINTAKERRVPKNFQNLVTDAERDLHFLQPPATEVEEYTGTCSLENIRNKEAKRFDCAAQAIPMIKTMLGKQTNNVRKLMLSSGNLAARLKAVNALSSANLMPCRQLSRKADESKKTPVPLQLEDEPVEPIVLTPTFKEWGITTSDQIDGGKLGAKVKEATEVVAKCLQKKPSLDFIGELVGEWKGYVRLSDLVAAHATMATGVVPFMTMLGFQHMFPGRLVPTTAPKEKVTDLEEKTKDYYREFLGLEPSEAVKDVYALRARNEPFCEFGDSPPEKFARYYDSKKQNWKEIREAATYAGEWRPAILKYCLLYAWSMLCEEGETGEGLVKALVSRFVLDSQRLKPLA